ncbi:hypothetical protein LCN94_04765 [Ruminococcus sp. FMB-CY1]|uniref:hypothetical protein n=1 Tax=unclassified Ruminococcus TaxID=2608920 RepID=UPI00208DFFFB|nr:MULTISPECIES: hypothetical protein [unclassified Ruminococcus]USP70408.1 hypothetical protein KGF34_03530 [Ruminococcus sp. FMBCY1]WBX58425.1 hypothetical protein LCN94_04765 [Ruminococcus sp. FMB-CY1]
MKVRVVVSFNDKTEGFINRPINEVFECSESRAKELIDGGFVTEVKSNATEKPKRKTTKTA